MVRNGQQQSRTRCWCFTLNNFIPDEVLSLRTLGRAQSTKYLIIGREVGENGTRHIQGFIQFKSPKSFHAAKRAVSERCHIEAAGGQPWQAADYCRKDGDYEEYGVSPIAPKEKGSREKERWRRIAELATQGSMGELKEQFPQAFVQHYSTLMRIRRDYMANVEDADGVTGVWYYGAPGAGKSRLARDRSEGSPYLKNCNKWWDGYQDERTVIIDDLDKNHRVLGHHLKIWADRYAFIAEVKGGAIRIRPQHIIVTSNYKPEEIFEDIELIRAIRRRFQILHLLTYNGELATFE